MARALGRTLQGYRERHHVIPRCMGGGDAAENIVELTAEEHYVAHQLLVKMHHGVVGLTLAAVRMAKQCTGNKAYGWLRRRYAAWRSTQSASMDTRAKMSKARMGHRHRPETKAKISAANLRNGNRPYITDTMRREIASRFLGTRRAPFSQEHRAKIGVTSAGRQCSPETRAKISAALKGRQMPNGFGEKIALAKRGVKRTPFKRTPHTSEHKAKISASRKAYFQRARLA